VRVLGLVDVGGRVRWWWGRWWWWGGGGRLAAGRRAGDVSDDDDADDGGPVCLEEAECMYDRLGNGNDSSTHSGPISFLYDHSVPHAC
jgi:hypothetical protein